MKNKNEFKIGDTVKLGEFKYLIIYIFDKKDYYNKNAVGLYNFGNERFTYDFVNLDNCEKLKGKENK